jgi:hypothetical protein
MLELEAVNIKMFIVTSSDKSLKRLEREGKLPR